MNPSQKFHALQRVRHFHEQKRAKEFSTAADRQKERLRQLEELRRYLGEYETSQSMIKDPLLLANHSAFLGRLRSAIKSQCEVVRDGGQKLEHDRARWMHARRDTSVIDQLASQCSKQEEKRADARAQEILDACGTSIRSFGLIPGR